jgi:hypothetical protein
LSISNPHHLASSFEALQDGNSNEGQGRGYNRVMVMTATKQCSYDGNGKDEDDNKVDRVTFQYVTISMREASVGGQ